MSAFWERNRNSSKSRASVGMVEIKRKSFCLPFTNKGSETVKVIFKSVHSVHFTQPTCLVPGLSAWLLDRVQVKRGCGRKVQRKPSSGTNNTEKILSTRFTYLSKRIEWKTLSIANVPILFNTESLCTMIQVLRFFSQIH